MKVAKEHIYEPVDEAAGLYRLAIPAGTEVTDEDMKRLKKTQVEEAADDASGEPPAAA